MKFQPISLTLLLCVTVFAYNLVACKKNKSLHIEEQQKIQEISQPIDLNTICNNLSKEMKEIDHTRTTFALEQINQNLKTCLPLMNFSSQMHLLNLSTAMYKSFLNVERTVEQQKAFSMHALDMAQHPTIQQNHHQEFSVRDQYLLRHKGQAYVEVYDAGDIGLVYRRNPQYLARIFAPYLPKAEKVFIEHLANQNINPVVRDHKITIEANILVERALFWENYIQQYPKSTYKKEAEKLFNLYSSLLFLGTQDFPTSQSFSSKQSVLPDHLNAIESVAQLTHSQLAKNARKFLKFLKLHSEKDSNFNPSITLRDQLRHYLQLEYVSKKDLSRCLSDAICQ